MQLSSKCSSVNFHQLSVRREDLPPTFCTAGTPSFHFRQRSQETFRQLLTTFRYGRETFLPLSVRPGDLPSTSVIFLYGWETVNFCQLSMQPVAFRQLQSAFRVAERPSTNFRELSMWPGDLPLISVNFPCIQETLGQLPSIFRILRRPFIKFCQHSVQPVDLPSTFVNFPCRQKTFCQLLSTSLATRRPSFNFSCCQKISRQLSVLLGDLPSTSVNFQC